MHPLRALAGLALLLALVGCDSFGEPERFVNEDARPPAVGALDFGSLRPGQHVAGDVRLSLRLDSLAVQVERVVLAVDGEEVEVLDRAPWALTLRTEAYAEGRHEVSVSVYVRGARLGLLGAVGAPAVHLAAPLVFDQREPTAVALTSVSVEDGRPRLTWEPSADANFYAYLVVRHAPWTPNVPEFGWLPVVDTLYDRAATEYLDVPLPPLYGAQAGYEVRVWNRREVSAPGGSLTASRGELVWGVASSGGGLFSPDGAEMYTLMGGTFAAVSTADHRELRRLNFDALTPGGHVPTRAFLNAAGTEILFSLPASGNAPDYGRRLHVFDRTTFRALRSFLLPEGAYSGLPGPGGRVYAVGGGRLHVLDGQTGAVRARTDVAFGEVAHAVAVSADGASVYVVDYSDDVSWWATATLHRVDVGAETPRPAVSFTWFHRQTPGWTTEVGSDGRVYLHTHPTMTVLDGRTLEQVGGYDLGLSRGWSQPTGLTIAAGRLYVSHLVQQPGGFDGGAVHEYDLASGRRLRTWDFAVQVGAIRTSGSGSLYVDSWQNSHGSYATWVLPL